MLNFIMIDDLPKAVQTFLSSQSGFDFNIQQRGDQTKFELIEEVDWKGYIPPEESKTSQENTQYQLVTLIKTSLAATKRLYQAIVASTASKDEQS